MEILAGIDDIDWASLSHAYGNAGDLPPILRAMASGTPSEAASALGQYEIGIHHQGDVYDSTVATIPFLIRMAIAHVPNAANILTMLASIAFHSRVRLNIDWYDDDSKSAMREALRLLDEARLLLEPLLRDDEPGIRVAARFLSTASSSMPDTAWTTTIDQDANEFARSILRRIALLETMTLTGDESDDDAYEDVFWELHTDIDRLAATGGAQAVALIGTRMKSKSEAEAQRIRGAVERRLQEEPKVQELRVVVREVVKDKAYETVGMFTLVANEGEAQAQITGSVVVGEPEAILHFLGWADDEETAALIDE